ncbi:hypothetical protein QAD02_007382 [Eretmocerus hayati]|uniref:Uncharacterized protein n=1 Tax=Eretmocerus hayati TaxID=131215 RepID=A0ACC2N3G2_9HYME|nr:hypothetical protein QAD02_007382 [Eretmocerus hayati]
MRFTHFAFPFETANKFPLAAIKSEKGFILQILSHMNLYRYEQVLESIVHPEQPTVLKTYNNKLSAPKRKKVFKPASITYFDSGVEVCRRYVQLHNVSLGTMIFDRAVINGCLFMSNTEENLRSCNYYAKTTGGKFIEIVKFLYDFDNSSEYTVCHSIKTRKNHICDVMNEVVGIAPQEGIICSSDIDVICVFVDNDSKQFISPIPNPYFY